MVNNLKKANLQAMLFASAGLLHLPVGLSGDRSGFLVAGVVFLCASSMIHRRQSPPR